MSQHDNYEDLTECALSPELEKKLVESLGECVFMWANSKGEPFGVVMSYLPKDGKLWLTAAETRKRIPALRRNPRSAICINSTGSKLGGGKTVTYKGNCFVHDDRATKDWFYPEFANRLRSGGRRSVPHVPRFTRARDHGIRSRLHAELRCRAHVGTLTRSRPITLATSPVRRSPCR